MFCVVKDCGSTSSNSTIFHFPEDITLRQTWLDVCGLLENDFSQKGVCHIHFKADQILTDSRTGFSSLIHDAVPSLFIPTRRETSSSSTNSWGASFYDLQKHQIGLVNGYQDQSNQLIECNNRLKRKVCLIQKKISELEKEKLNRYTDLTEQNTMMEQMLRLNHMSPFKLKKVNKVVETNKKELMIKKNGLTNSCKLQTGSPKLDTSLKLLENVLDEMETISFVSDSLKTNFDIINSIEENDGEAME